MYLYETHLHTSYASACSRSKGSEYIKLYKDLGYSGIIVTDHFYNGHTAVPRNLPWKEWVKQFCKGYEEAKNEGDKQGLDVFFGWEETFDHCDDYLVYGLSKDWLFENPQAKSWSRKEQYETVKALGGIVIQAHPFRQHYYLSKIILSTGCVDAIEAANAGNMEQHYDSLAARYARKLALPITAGSDMHDARQIYSSGLFGIYCNEKAKTIYDIAKAISSKSSVGIKASEGRLDTRGDEKIILPVEIRDKRDRRIRSSFENFI
jgi:hypothetical protein